MIKVNFISTVFCPVQHVVAVERMIFHLSV